MSGTETQSFDIACQSCGRNLRVDIANRGKRIRCPQCQNVQVADSPQAAAMAGQSGASSGPSESPMPSYGQPPQSQAPQSQPQSQPPQSQPSYGQSQPSYGQPPAQSSAPPPPQPSYGAPNYGGGSSGQSSSVAQAILGDRARQDEGRQTPTRQLFDRIMDEVSKIYVGQDELVRGTLTALFSSGHVLIESVPGLGKTLFVRTLGKVLGCEFGRIQFTADLMPSDITGAPLFDMKTQEFRFRPGPVFTQFLLADEINRSPAKTHAALLEIMQEYRVTIDGVSHPINKPFLVMATQNPLESEGTYNLPEAQLDRFMFKLMVDYPSAPEEAEILKMHSRQEDLSKRMDEELETVTGGEEIMRITKENADVRVEDKLINYINELVRRTRQWPQFYMGASPRAGIALMQAARTLAAFQGRDYAIPDDVVEIALPALRHRVMLTAEAEVEGQKVDALLVDLIRSVEVPRL